MINSVLRVLVCQLLYYGSRDLCQGGCCYLLGKSCSGDQGIFQGINLVISAGQWRCLNLLK